MRMPIAFVILMFLIGCSPAPSVDSSQGLENGIRTSDPNTPLPPVVPGQPPVVTGLRLTLTAASKCGASAVVSIWPYGSWHPQTPETYKLTMPTGHSQTFPLNPGQYEVLVEGQGDCRATPFPVVAQNQVTAVTLACSCIVYGKTESNAVRKPASAGKTKSVTKPAK